MPLGKEAFINKLEEYDPGSSTVVRKIFDLIESVEKTLDFVEEIEDFKPSMIKEIFSEHTEFLKVANYSVDEVLDKFGVSKKQEIYSTATGVTSVSPRMSLTLSTISQCFTHI